MNLVLSVSRAIFVLVLCRVVHVSSCFPLASKPKLEIQQQMLQAENKLFFFVFWGVFYFSICISHLE